LRYGGPAPLPTYVGVIRLKGADLLPFPPEFDGPRPSSSGRNLGRCRFESGLERVPRIEVYPFVYEQLELLAREWNTTVGEVVARLVNDLSQPAMTAAEPRSSVSAAPHQPAGSAGM